MAKTNRVAKTASKKDTKKDTKKDLAYKLQGALAELAELKRIHEEKCKELSEERKQFRELLALYTAAATKR